jgi:hypothetical protein
MLNIETLLSGADACVPDLRKKLEPHFSLVGDIP